MLAFLFGAGRCERGRIVRGGERPLWGKGALSPRFKAQEGRSEVWKMVSFGELILTSQNDKSGAVSWTHTYVERIAECVLCSLFVVPH